MTSRLSTNRNPLTKADPDSGKENLDVKKILQRKSQFTFFVILLLVLGILIPFVQDTSEFLAYLEKNKPEGYDIPQVKDFLIVIETLPFYHVFYILIFKLFYEQYKKICKEKNDLTIIEKRTKKGVSYIYKTIYFTTITIIGYYFIRDSDLLPPSLGGHGSLGNFWFEYPYQKKSKYFKYYYLISMGYHLHQTILQLADKEKT